MFIYLFRVYGKSKHMEFVLFLFIDCLFDCLLRVIKEINHNK